MDEADLKVVRSESGNECMDPLLGMPLRYDEGFDADGQIDHFTYEEPGEVAKAGMAYGLPAKVNGNPNLGCGCSVAYLHATGDITQDGMIEADYMCDSGWHNFFVFELNMQERKRQVTIDKDGNLQADEGFTAGDLEEY